MAVSFRSTGGGGITLDSANTASEFSVIIPAANGEMVTTNSNSTVRFATGNTTAPSITTTASPTTGIYFPANNVVAISTNGVERFRAEANGFVTINGASPGGGGFRGNAGLVGTAASPDIFRVHAKTLTVNTTILATENAMAAGPLTVANGVTLTVANGGRLVIV